MKNNLLIIGASGHGKVISNIAREMKKWNVIHFLDDNKTNTEKNIIGEIDDVFLHLDNYDIFVGIGDNSVRKRIYEMLENYGATIPMLIHPSAFIGEKVEIGKGTVVMPGVIVNYFSKIGKGCIINSGSIIEHDNNIQDFVHISPGVKLAGAVNIGEESWLGIGSIVSNNVSITDKCKIGAGTVVIENISEAGVYVGAPARKL